MTIAGRNKWLIFSITVTGLLLITGLGCVVFLVLHRIIETIPVPSFRQEPLSSLFSYNNVAVVTGTAAIPLLSLIILLSVFFRFEKTHAIELSFFCLFIFSISFDVLLLFFPLCNDNYIFTFLITHIARIIFFFRFMGVLALFVSGLFAYKVFTRETGWIIFLLCFISFALSRTVPINIDRTRTFFLFSRHYRYLLYSFDGILYLLSVLTFCFAGVYRRIPEYTRAGFSLAIVLTAYMILRYTGSWTSITAGIAIFVVGVRSFIKTIQQFYLWQEL